MFRFANIGYLNWLYILPLLIITWVIMRYRKQRIIRKLGEDRLLSVLMPEVSVVRPVMRFILLVLALLFIILGLARPQFGTKLKEVKREGVELVIALDVSNSMLAEDIRPNRLERARMAIAKLVEKLENDRIALIVFAGDAFVQVPMTQDYATVKMFLSTVNTNIVPRQGTAIAAAIDMAMKSFNFENNLEKSLIIITDGENHEDNPVESAKVASEKGVKIHAIGMGSPDGAPIPSPERYGSRLFRKDDQGGVIITRLDENILKQIANSTGGMYVRATNSDLGLQAIYKEIGKMEKKEMEVKVRAEYDDQFQYFFSVALFFLILEFVILERKNRWFSSSNIFNFKW